MQKRLSGWLKFFIPANLRSDRSFSIEDHFCQTRQGVIGPHAASTKQSANIFWILSRGCYAVKVLELGSVPEAKRLDAIRLAIAGWSPFSASEHYVVPAADSAIICAWDAAATTALILESGADIAQLRVLPESALRRFEPVNSAIADLTKNTAALYRAVDGFVGVFHGASRILAEQWWPELPSDSNWRNFLRSTGQLESADPSPPAAITLPWLKEPLGFLASQVRNSTSQRELLVVYALALALSFPTIWYANELRQLFSLKREAAQRLLSTEKTLDVALNAREQSLSAQQRATQLLELFSQPDPLQLFLTVSNVLSQIAAAGALQLGDWDLRPQQLKFSIQATSGAPPAATALVKALEQETMFRDVEVRTDGSRVNITIRLVKPSGGQAADSSSPAPKPAPKLAPTSSELMPPPKKAALPASPFVAHVHANFEKTNTAGIRAI
ncbi:MAG: hypothetical protein H7232_03430 [Aeromicrobium sp.]|nr:hypothetical protein [Burkholderiales bacterium]